MAKTQEYVVVRDYMDKQVAWMHLTLEQVEDLEHLGMGVFHPLGTRDGFLILEKNIGDGFEVWAGEVVGTKSAPNACGITMVCTIDNDEVADAVVSALGADLPKLIAALENKGEFDLWQNEEQVECETTVAEEDVEAAPAQSPTEEEAEEEAGSEAEEEEVEDSGQVEEEEVEVPEEEEKPAPAPAPAPRVRSRRGSK